MKSKKKTDVRSEKELSLLTGTSEASKVAYCLLRLAESKPWGGYQYCPPQDHFLKQRSSNLT